MTQAKDVEKLFSIFLDFNFQRFIFHYEHKDRFMQRMFKQLILMIDKKYVVHKHEKGFPRRNRCQDEIIQLISRTQGGNYTSRKNTF